MRVWAFLGLGMSTLLACGGDDPQGAGAGAGAGTGAGGSTGGGVPTGAARLVPWLEAGEYLTWPAEDGRHESSGPHFGAVRVFVNDVLDTSLASGGLTHPANAAAVKELFGDGDAVRGWAVSLKRGGDSADGAGWYWFEIYDDTTFADGDGVSLCTGCHSGGGDFFLSPYPL